MCKDLITPELEKILQCVLDRAVACEQPGWCRTGLVAGTVAWDDCCDCGENDGQLWVRLADWSPDPNFPSPGPSVNCAQPSSLTVGVGSLRCIPTIDDSGLAPSVEEELAAASRVHRDAQLIFNSVMCCLDERDWNGWVPLGYEGGCGGGEHLFTVPWYPCDCSEPIPEEPEEPEE